jgi:hypothetical protein
MINDPTTAPAWPVAHLLDFIFQELGHCFGAPLEDEARRFKVDRQLAQVRVTFCSFCLIVLTCTYVLDITVLTLLAISVGVHRF